MSKQARNDIQQYPPVEAPGGAVAYRSLGGASSSMMSTPSAMAMRSMLSTVTLRSHRSIELMYVRCRSAASAKASCEKPLDKRSSRTRAENRSLAVGVPRPRLFMVVEGAGHDHYASTDYKFHI